MIIGLTGTNAAGKDTVAEYLEKEKGFAHYSLSDELRRELGKRGEPALRENLIRIGTELRASEGDSVLAKRAAVNFVSGRNYVITSVRHPAEITELKRYAGFFVVNVDAPATLRFERIRTRNRPGDPQSLEKMLEMEMAESQTSGPGQQLGECRKMADFTLKNDAGGVEELHKRIDRMLELFCGAGGEGLKADLPAIMVVDDDEDANFTLKSILEYTGYRVFSFFNGGVAMDKIGELKPDLVILDVMMPGMDGYEVCRRIKGDPRTSTVPVIMLTAKAMGEDVEKALDNKADWYVAKPYDYKYLVSKIGQFLKKKP